MPISQININSEQSQKSKLISSLSVDIRQLDLKSLQLLTNLVKDLIK